MFNCEGAENTACLQTGEEVLVSLSFQSHTVSYPVFGQGMLIIGFLCVAFSVLSLSQLTFLKLGHVGAKYQSVIGAVPPTVVAEKADVDRVSEHDSIPERDIENSSGKMKDIEREKAGTVDNSHDSTDNRKQVIVENANEAESKSDVAEQQAGLIA